MVLNDHVDIFTESKPQTPIFCYLCFYLEKIFALLKNVYFLVLQTDTISGILTLTIELYILELLE